MQIRELKALIADLPDDMFVGVVVHCTDYGDCGDDYDISVGKSIYRGRDALQVVAG